MLTPEQIRLAEEAAEEAYQLTQLAQTIADHERREAEEQEQIDQARHEGRY